MNNEQKKLDHKDLTFAELLDLFHDLTFAKFNADNLIHSQKKIIEEKDLTISMLRRELAEMKKK